MKTNSLLSFTILFFLIPLVSIAGQPKIKFGKIDMNDMTMNQYASDSSAGAVVLADIGRSYFDYNPSTGLALRFERHLRIKILKKSGYDFANHAINLYSSSNSNREQISLLKGATYNLVDGKIETSKLTKDGIFDEETSKYRKQKKVTLPDVQEGSIIEIKYSIESPFFKYFRNWSFQRSIPTVWSMYTVSIPDFLIYQKRMQGYNSPVIYEESELADQHLGKINIQKIAFENVPAFKSEPYMTSRKDYISKVIYELASTKIPGQVSKIYTTTWEKVSETYLDYTNFGMALKNSKFAEPIVESLLENASSDDQKINAVVNHLKSRFLFTGDRDYTSNGSLKKAYESKEGNATDINLTLVAFLQKAGFQADPVILSTRSNGFLRTSYPNTDQFNYTLCLLRIENGFTLLDATDPYLPNDAIPERCLNGQGLLVKKDYGQLVNISARKNNKSKASATVKIHEDGTFDASFQKVYDGYWALDERKEIANKGIDTYLESMKEDATWEIENLEVSRVEELAKSVSMKYEVVEGEEGIEMLGNNIYVSPLLALQIKDNPFKALNREFPVDFACPWESIYLGQIEIPEGFVIAERPENTAFSLPEKSGQFIYTISVSGNRITVMSKIKVNKALFVQTEYQYLRSFYEQIIAKQAQQIVLKKA